MEERDNIVQSLLTYLNQFNIHVDQSDSGKSEQDFMTDCISACMESIRKEQKQKIDLQDSLKQLEFEYKDLNLQVDGKDTKIHELEGDVARLENLLSLNNLKFKQEKDKLTSERDQAKKEFMKISSLCNQYLHEIKKRENEYVRLQEQMRKSMGEKDLQYKNTIEIMNGFHKNGIGLSGAKGDEEFLHFIKQGHIGHNKGIREYINLLSETIEKTFSAIKTELSKLGHDVDWKPLNPENSEIYRNEIDYRLKHFESCLKNVQKLAEDSEFPQESIPVLKQVLDSYKEILDSGILSLLKVE